MKVCEKCLSSLAKIPNDIKARKNLLANNLICTFEFTLIGTYGQITAKTLLSTKLLSHNDLAFIGTQGIIDNRK